MSLRLLLLFLLAGLGYTGVSVHAWGTVAPVPSESECRPYIEKALKELSTDTTQEAVDTAPSSDNPQTTDTSEEGTDQEGSIEGTEASVTTDSAEKEDSKSGEEDDQESNDESKETKEQDNSKETDDEVEPKNEEESGETEEKDGSGEQREQSGEQSEETENKSDDNNKESQQIESTENVELENNSGESEEATAESKDESTEKEADSNEVKEESDEEVSTENVKSSEDLASVEEQQSGESVEEGKESIEEAKSTENSTEETDLSSEVQGEKDTSNDNVKASDETEEDADEIESITKDSQTESDEKETNEESGESAEQLNEPSVKAGTVSAEESDENKSNEEPDETEIKPTDSDESQEKNDDKETESEESVEKPVESAEEEDKEGKSDEDVENISKEDEESKEGVESKEGAESKEGVESKEADSKEGVESKEADSKEEKEGSGESGEETDSAGEESEEERTPEEDLTIDVVIPEKLRPREHIGQILKLDPESMETELLLAKTMDVTLRDLKRLYDSAIQPLEILYKYRDLSNRHFGDPEIFSKPLILFMGPWSGGKSTIINYLLNNEHTKSALRTGAEPSPAYFNILMWGEQEEVLDGTQLAADWTFSGLQKFGQGLLDRLRGLKLKNPLLEKVNIVEIPGILEIRKQVERLFPFNDACQWFIDRADIIFLVYDPSKLDVGPETEAILDQLKGREYQTRIILNKADQVKPEELMRVQGTLIWNISPLMSSSEPPVMYSTSLWSIPYEVGSPTRLLYAQEKAFLKDLRDAIDRRVENKIASARRFAVRVRNHAKMVDCYLTTYYNHKSFFGNRKKVADDIIEHPQNYHIYEGLSTLTNISRYDLPDPEVYRDFFRLNAVYDFQKLSATCTYFRGCPINRLDVAIAYDLPELVGKYKKQAESVLASADVPPKS